MKIVTSVSGGKTSAYLAANYPADELVFALVRTSDETCKFKDRVLAKQVEDRIGAEFIGTLEDDEIIYTMLDLEQYLGKEINWVTGITFDEVVGGKNTILPSLHRRFCTELMKITPIFYWWHEKFNAVPVQMNIGYRDSEKEIKRSKTMLSKTNKDGLSVFDATFEKHVGGGYGGKNKWEKNIAWRMPKFPLIEDGINKSDINKYWKGKPVRFAKLNNCIGCFHRSAPLLKKMSELHPDKFDWFANQEGKFKTKDGLGKGYWQDNISYKKIKKMNFTLEIDFEGVDDEGCASGYCHG